MYEIKEPQESFISDVYSSEPKGYLCSLKNGEMDT